MTTSDSRTTLQKNIGIFISKYYDNKDKANKDIYEQFTNMITELRTKTGELKTSIQTLATYVAENIKDEKIKEAEEREKTVIPVVTGTETGVKGGRKSKKSKKYKKSKKSKKSRKSKKSKTRR